MDTEFLQQLNSFIVSAKAATYVGSGEHTPPCRPGSHDLAFFPGGLVLPGQLLRRTGFHWRGGGLLLRQTRLGHELLRPHPYAGHDPAGAGGPGHQGELIQVVH